MNADANDEWISNTVLFLLFEHALFDQQPNLSYSVKTRNISH